MQNKKEDEGHLMAFGATAMTFSGPLPPADEFRRYNEAHPGTAERMLDWAERQAEHRRAQENKELDSRIKLSHTGQWCAFSIAMLSLVAVTASALLDRPVLAIIPAVVALVSLAAVFIRRK